MAEALPSSSRSSPALPFLPKATGGCPEARRSGPRRRTTSPVLPSPRWPSKVVLRLPAGRGPPGPPPASLAASLEEVRCAASFPTTGRPSRASGRRRQQRAEPPCRARAPPGGRRPRRPNRRPVPLRAGVGLASGPPGEDGPPEVSGEGASGWVQPAQLASAPPCSAAAPERRVSVLIRPSRREGAQQMFFF
jgi:hypothetical protein